ncbi:MAG: 50S ribosomal protein L24 [Lachnospiraceae bacterium]|nr:50S ribosomal protein L24 [Lachnospiraceae bacterium]
MSKIKVGDTVRIIAGKEKGREGKVLRIDHKAHRLVVEGANMITKHNKQNAQNPNGGILRVEGTIDMSNVMLLFKGEPVRVGFTTQEDKDGKLKKVRVAKTADGPVVID